MVPRLATPSTSCRLAVMLPPQVPLAVKLNGCETGVPFVETTPYVCGALVNVTPLLATNVATRLDVLALPIFLSERLAVTVSPGSTTLLPGKQLSADNE